jgi:coenzyme F420-reducing hydrogenase beta subunit
MARTSLEGSRVHVIVTRRQEEFLRRHSRSTGMTVSEILRRAIDNYIVDATEKTARTKRA